MTIQDQYPEKYRSLIDDETWRFIERTAAWYPSEAVEWPVEKIRQNYNALCKDFYAEYPTSVRSCDLNIPNPAQGEDGRPTISARLYGRSLDNPLAPLSSANAVVLYLHGGGFVVGDLESHDDICAEICDRTGFPVLAVDYALAPEFTYPTDLQNVQTALGWLHHNLNDPTARIIGVGDSAGANLIAGLSHKTRRDGQTLAGQVLIYPALASVTIDGSYQAHAHAPLLTTEEMHYYKKMRLGEDSAAIDAVNDPFCFPLDDVDYSDLPSTVVFSAECDPLCGDGNVYCTAIREAGGEAEWIMEAGLVHGYLRARHCVQRAGESFERIIEATNRLGVSH